MRGEGGAWEEGSGGGGLEGVESAMEFGLGNLAMVPLQELSFKPSSMAVWPERSFPVPSMAEFSAPEAEEGLADLGFLFVVVDEVTSGVTSSIGSPWEGLGLRWVTRSSRAWAKGAASEVCFAISKSLAYIRKHSCGE